MEMVIVGIRKRRMARHSTALDSSLAEYALLVGSFLRMRRQTPLPYSCLSDSLALLMFLSQYGLLPYWVFGVRMNPFGAHCWLQEGQTVVNDKLDAVLNYTPIMSA
jgi:hypothetical protein